MSFKEIKSLTTGGLFWLYAIKKHNFSPFECIFQNTVNMKMYHVLFIVFISSYVVSCISKIQI